MKTPKGKTAKKRWDEARNSLKRIQEEIAPFRKKISLRSLSLTREWKESSSTPVTSKSE
jgi:hypothetical protein